MTITSALIAVRQIDDLLIDLVALDQVGLAGDARGVRLRLDLVQMDLGHLQLLLEEALAKPLVLHPGRDQ